MGKTEKKKVVLALWLIAILATGCFQPASTELQEPTIGSDLTKTSVPLPVTATAQSATPPPDQATLPSIAETATSLAATWAATGVSLPTQQPTTLSTDQANVTPGQSTPPPTPTDASPLVTPPQLPLAPDDSCMHVLQPGENLFRLSLAWNTTVAEIANLNGLTDPDSVAAGTVLHIPGCTEGQVPSSGQLPSSGGGQTYVVQPGDTTYGIARRFGVSLQAIIDANPALQANPDQLTVGQELVIP
jgi:LysM repeat protein